MPWDPRIFWLPACSGLLWRIRQYHVYFSRVSIPSGGIDKLIAFDEGNKLWELKLLLMTIR